MKIDAAIVKEQGITFVIVIVKQQVIQTQTSANDMRQSLSKIADFSFQTSSQNILNCTELTSTSMLPQQILPILKL